MRRYAERKKRQQQEKADGLYNIINYLTYLCTGGPVKSRCKAEYFNEKPQTAVPMQKTTSEMWIITRFYLIYIQYSLQYVTTPKS
jgi:hypothetical protein